MKPYLFTVPSRFRTEPHPLGIGPEDLFVIHADSEEDARKGANFRVGQDTWDKCYAADDPRGRCLRSDFYPDGRIVYLSGVGCDPTQLWPEEARS